MPKLDFTVSETEWYAREAAVAKALVDNAALQGRQLLGTTLAKICESHQTPNPGNVELLRGLNGQAVGIIWGPELKDWMDGKLKIEGVLPPPRLPQAPPPPPPSGEDKPPAPPAPAEGAPAPAQTNGKHKKRG